MTADVASRIRRVQASMVGQSVDALLVTPSADLRYLTGYDARPLERLTALVVPAASEPVLLVPALERAEAERSAAALAGMQVLLHEETDDALAMALDVVPDAALVTVDDHMWAARVLAIQAARPTVSVRAAGRLLAGLRMRKGRDEVASLRQAAAAIDRVHARMGEFLRVGRSEREAAALIAGAILAEGHATVDFVIVGSGPNGASPHHSVSDRVIEPGDPVVVDIGGSTADGYRSDCTRTYVVGAEPDAAFAEYYDVLLQAQRTQCDFARAGVTAESVDRVGRRVLADAGYAEFFVHRTGHGIGLETHEEPYIVEGNQLVLEAGMAFSIEPGIYLPGQHGARIEDIVIANHEGVERLNTTTRELSVLEG
ncbi:MAG: aminopeptidase P family protein [Nocardioidaceae bacterium]|nr:aminopeptidase P family protein [Nocardioidaceae bacterium]